MSYLCAMCMMHSYSYKIIKYSHCTLKMRNLLTITYTQRAYTNVNGKVSFIYAKTPMRKHTGLLLLDYCLVSNYILFSTFDIQWPRSNLNFILISKSQKTNNLNERLFVSCYSKIQKKSQKPLPDSQSIVMSEFVYNINWGLSMRTHTIAYFLIKNNWNT